MGGDPTSSGLHARRLALALADEQLRAGFDVVLGQYLARTTFLEDLERLAQQHRAAFVELVLDLPAEALAERLAGRAAHPDRPEHAINARLVGPADAADLTASIEALKALRPGARWIDASGPVAATLGLVLAALPADGPREEQRDAAHG